MNRRSAVFAKLVPLLLVGFTLQAHAQEKKVTLRLSHNLPATNALHTDVLLPWSRSIEKAAGGSVTIRIFPAQQLGATKDHYNLARDGIADLSLYVLGIEPGRFPIVGAADMPFLLSDSSKGSRALHEWYLPHANQEMPDVKVCTVMYDAGGTIHSRGPIRTPADMKGVTIRTANLPAANYFRAAGAAPVQMAATDAAEAAERGMVDAIMFPWSLLKGLGADRALKHHLDTGFYFLGTAILMNTKSYEKLGDSQRKIIDDHCNADWAEKLSKSWYANDQKGREVLAADRSHTLHTLNDAEIVEWKALSATLQKDWEKSISASGRDGAAIFNDLKQRLQKYGAAH